MDLLRTINECIADQPMPLTAITVAAVPCPDTPIILTLHWHGFVRERIAAKVDAEIVDYVPFPSIALQLNHRWDDLIELDRAALEAGWELGAWDVARATHPGCARPGADSIETLECLQAFGTPAQTFRHDPVVLNEAPDISELVDLAARNGYLMWKFRPAHHGLWADFANDATLGADGRRDPPCPVRPSPVGYVPGQTVYRLGQPEIPAH